ncbi:TlpA family protein disulfide reductase [Nonomuraea glycinis]|uniref:TlpA family protein disulfide reductase n=1 Tax=Nonomuraea glycinis TaxID=2047744 RepID=UPI002E113984|nr:thioredoxin family protein [Nonomuraea glycinis]
MTGLWVVLATLALGSVIGLVRLLRDGRMRDFAGRARSSGGSAGSSVEVPAEEDGEGMASGSVGRLTGGDLGSPLGERATLVQFSTAFCQPCRATRRVLAEVSELVPGVAHVEVDAESRLDLVRRLDVMRTPTVFVLDSSGNILKKASGQPRKADVLNVLGRAVPAAPGQDRPYDPSHGASQDSDEM